MRPKYDESLFEHTKMTFGEHLEELRICLFRAIAGIVIGFLIGLLVASRVVQWIETPLRDAMDRYYVNRAISRLDAQFGNVPEDVKTLIEREKMTYDEVLVERQELIRAMREAGGGTPDRSVSGTSPTAEVGAPVKSSSDPTTDASARSASSGQRRQSPTLPSADMVRMRLWQPVETEIRTLNAQEPFLIWLKAAGVVGLILASPWVFYQIWAFVAAGLYPHEKSYVRIYLPISIGLFLAGAVLVFAAVFRPVLDFLLSYNQKMGLDPDPRISEWMGFVLMLPVGFGIAFQLPLVMLFVERIGIVTFRSFVEKWRIAILVIAFVSMVLTPADPISMMLMAAPLSILYFAGLALIRWMPRRQSPFGPGYDPV